jgi:signal transduction histidine kinase
MSRSPDSPLGGLEGSLAARATALWIGFASLLLLMLFTAADSTRAMHRLEEVSANARTEARDRDRLLDSLRTDIYHASTVLRDYLVEIDDESATAHRRELQQVRARIDNALSEYRAKLPEYERGSLDKLQADIVAYGQSLEPPLAWSPAERARRSDAYLQSEVIPHRREAVDLVRQIERLNDREVESVERELIAAQVSMQRRMTMISAVTILLGALIAVVSGRRIRRLERDAEHRYEQVRELSAKVVNAQEDERRRLSRELHDQLGQTSAAVVAELARLEREELSGGARRDRIAAARRLAEDNVRSIRDISLLLRPSMLDDLGLLPALRWQAREIRVRSGLKVQVQAEGVDGELPDPLRTCIYRVVQEALHNCVKHARATEAQLALRQDQAGLSIVIKDNGSGFDPARDKGVGILGMEERVQRLGGTFQVASQPGQGVILSMSFPKRV